MCLTGFNSERPDPVCGHYHLGNGYRAYSPALMRFICPDSMSPFGVGGINPYAYCGGDPVNHADPTGHLDWQAGLGIGMGILGLGLALFTGGSSIVAAVAAVAAESTAIAAVGTPIVSLAVWGAGVVADVTAIASGATEDKNPKASSILSWVSLAAGVAGMVHGVSGILKGSSNRPFGGLMIESATGDPGSGQFRNVRLLGRGWNTDGQTRLYVRYDDDIVGKTRRNYLVLHDSQGVSMSVQDNNQWVDRTYTPSEFHGSFVAASERAIAVHRIIASETAAIHLPFVLSIFRRFNSQVPVSGFTGAVDIGGLAGLALKRTERYIDFLERQWGGLLSHNRIQEIIDDMSRPYGNQAGSIQVTGKQKIYPANAYRFMDWRWNIDM